MRSFSLRSAIQRVRNRARQTAELRSLRPHLETMEDRITPASTTEDAILNLSASDLGVATIAVADYRDDFQATTPKPGWSYQFNGGGAGNTIGTAAGYQNLVWNSTLPGYAASASVFPSGNPGQYVFLGSTGGHPGAGVNEGASIDRYAIAGYTVGATGAYSITNSFVNRSAGTNELDIRVYVGDTQKLQATQTVANQSFNVDLGIVNAGQKIYVAIGPKGTHNNDSFTLDFTIAQSAYISALNSSTSTLGAALTLNNGVVTYNPTATAPLQALDYLATASDSVSVTYLVPGSGTASASIPVTVLGLPDPPDAKPDAAATMIDTPIPINVLANDTITNLVIADFKDDFQGPTPTLGWAYKWNSGGAIGTAANYTPLSWTGAGTYDGDGAPGLPAAGSAGYVFFSSTGVHPGQGTAQGAGGIDRYAIAEYAVPVKGSYSITNSDFHHTDAGGAAVDLRVYVDDVLKLSQSVPQSAAVTPFDMNLGILNAGQKIYVCVGPAGDHSNDGASIDFTVRLNSAPTISSLPATSAMGAALSFAGGTVTYDPTTSAAAGLIGPGQSAIDTFQYTVDEPGVGSKTATVTVTLLGLFNNDMNQSGVGGNNGSPDTIKVMLAPGGAQRQVFVNNVLYSQVPLSAGPLAFTGSSDNDTLIVDFTNGNPIPAGGISFDGGTGSDALTLTGGSTTTVTHNTVSSSSGNIVLAGALAGTITYTGLEPINDNMNAVDRVFNFTGGTSVVPGLLHQWTFNDTADTTPNDSVGTSHGTLFNGATVVSGGAGQGLLSLDGVNDYMRSSVIGENITAKTLVAWVRLNNLAQQAGSALTLENPTGGDVFDGIIYAERTANQWMNGSNGFTRSPVSNGGPGETVVDPGEVMIAITYAADNTITLYRNGVAYGSPYVQGTLQTYATGIADVLIGVRHEDLAGGSGSVTGADGFLAGLVNEARIYGAALTPAQISQLASEGPVVGNVTTDEVVTLTDAAGANMTIDSNLSESITFANPSNSITINTGVDSDTLNITSMDAGFTGSLIVDGGSHNDFVNINTGVSLAGLNITAENINVAGVTVTTTGNQTYAGLLSLTGSTLNPGAGSVVIAGNVSTTASASTSTIQGQVNLNGGTPTFTVADGAAANDLSITGIVSNGSLTKAGPGTLLLSGANTYAGTTTVSAGTLKLSGGAAIPDGAGKGNVVVSATLDLNGSSETVNGLSGGGTVTNTGAAATFTAGGNDQSSTFTGSFTGPLGLTKTGAGTLLIGGASTYTGATTVNGGTLKLAPTAPVVGSSLKLWLDAADTASITRDGSGFVSQWNDKSGALGGGGAGTVTQVTAATGNRPVSGSTSQNGRNLLHFDGNDGLIGPAVLAAGDDDYTFFAVWKPSIASGIQDVFEQNTSTLQGSRRASLLAINTAYGFNGESNDRHDLVPFAAGAWRTTSLEVNNALFDGTNNIRILDNGTQFLGRTGDPNALDLGADAIAVGYKLNTVFGEGLNGDLAELVVYDGILSAADRQSVLDYLNSKWFGTLPGVILPTTTAVTVATGATLDTSGSSITIGSLAGGLGSVAMGAGTLTVGDGTSTTFGGVISGTGGLTKAGGGTLTLLGANTYTGPTNITAGTVKLGSQPATAVTVVNNSFESPVITAGNSNNGVIFGPPTGWTGGAMVINGSTLGYNQPNTTFGTQAALLQGTNAITQTIVFPFAGTYTMSFSAANRNCCVAPAGNPLQIRVDGVNSGPAVTAPGLTYSVVNMQFTVATAGSHAITLAGTSAVDRTTFVDNLTITSVSSSPTVLPDASPVTISGGAFLDIAGTNETIGSLFGTGTVTNSAAAATLSIGADNAASASFGGAIQNGPGVLSVTKTGSGTQAFTGTNTFTGATTVSTGTLTLTGGTALADTSDVTVAGALNITSSETLGSLAGAGAVTLANGITLSTGASGASTTFSGVISGSAGVTKVGGGVFTVSGVNTYAGATNIQTGTLRLANGSVVPVTNGSFETPAVVSANGYEGTLRTGWTGAGATVTNTSNLGYAQPASAFGTQASLIQQLSNMSQAMTFPLPGVYNITFFAAGRNSGANPLQIRLDGVTVTTITPPVSVYTFFSVPVTVASAGSHTIGFFGTSVPDRTTFVDNVIVTAALGVPVVSPVTVAGGATFDINGTNAGVDSVAGTGTITNSNATAASLSIGINNATGMSFGGVIQNGTGTLAITKAGTGDLTLTGSNTYSGATTVSAGTLVASGGAALPDGSAVTVAAAANLNVQNTETIGSLAGAGNVALAAGITLTTGADNTATLFDGAISGAGANLIKTGSAIFSFGGTNTYSGSTQVLGGTLKLVGVNSVTVANNSFETPAVVAANGYEGTPRTGWTGPSATVTNTSNLGYAQPASAFGTQAALIQQLSVLSQPLTFPAAGAYSLNFWAAGRNSGANPLSITIDGVQISLVTPPVSVYTFFSIPFTVATAGSHTLTFNGTSVPDRTSFLDNVTVTSVLSIPSTSPVTVAGGAVLDVNGGTASVTTLSGAGTVTNTSATASTFFLGINDGTGGNFSGVIQNGTSSIALSKIGTGTATLSGANTFTGPVNVSAGTLTVSGGAAIANAVNVTVAAGGTLNVLTSETIGSLTGPTGSSVTLASGVVLDLGGNGTSTTFSGVISGSGGVTKSGAGTFTVGGNNTYGGATNVAQGTLKLATPAAVAPLANPNLETPQGPFNTAAPDFATNAGYWYAVPPAQGSWTFTGAGIARNGSAFNLPSNTAQGGTQVMFIQNLGVASQTLSLVPGYYTLNFWSAYRNNGQTANPLNISIGGTSLFTAFTPASNTTWTNYSTNFTITTAGNYAFTFTGTNATGDRTTFIDTISLTGVPAGVSSNYLPNGSTLTVATGAFFEMSGQSEAVGSLLGGGTITSTAPVAVNLTIGGDNLASADFTGILQDGPAPGTLGLIKDGTGAQILSGNNPYTGQTLAAAGKLIVNGSLADGPAPTDVTVGSNATLGGRGTVAGTVSVANLGHLAPGNSIDTITLSNAAASVVFANGATYDVEFDGTATDKAIVSTVPTLTNVTLNLAYIGPVTPLPTQNTYIIIDNQTASPFTTTFSGLPEGAPVAVTGANWPAGYRALITYTAGVGGNDVALYMDAPEPPVANPDPTSFPNPNYSVVQNTTLSVTAANGVLVNDTDPDPGTTLSVQSYTATSAAGALVTVNANGSFTYDPRNSAALRALAAGEVGTDTFQYTVADIALNPLNTNTGTAATALGGLLGSDLTDPENNGDPENNIGYNANFFASIEPQFGGAEAAFNVFDNQVGGGNMKWCCDAAPQWVAAQFASPRVLTHFTLTSGNDSPERSPDIFQIQGSNNSSNGSDGTWFNIYAYSNEGTSPFTGVNQTRLFTSSQGRTDLTGGATQYETGGLTYTWFRYNVVSTVTNGGLHQLGEVEFFGVAPTPFLTATATVTIQVTGVNDPPVAVNDPPSFPNVNYQTNEDTTLVTNAANGLLANDSDPDNGATITVASASATSTMGATVTVGATGNFTYNPATGAALQALDQGQVVTDTFGYTIVDGVVTPQSTNTGAPGVIRPGLIGGDLTDPENNGDPENNVGYNANFFASIEAAFGGGEFAFNVFDNQVGGGNSKWCCDAAPQWVAAQFASPIVLTHFTLTSGNDAPERQPDIFQIQGSSNSTNGADGSWFNIYAYSNDGTSPFTGNDQTRLFTSSQGRTDLTGGTTQYETGGIAYTWFRYNVVSTVTNGGLHQLGEVEFFGVAPTAFLSASATVSIQVTGVNDAPVGVADTNSVTEAVDSTAGTPVNGNVLTNDTDPDDPTAQFTVTTTGSFVGLYGTLVLNANGTYTYTLNNASPAVNALNVGGTLVDTFSYTLSDNHPSGNVKTGAGTLNITVNGANDTPVPSNDTAGVTEDVTLTATGNLLTNDADDNSPLFVSAVNSGASSPAAGTYGSLAWNTTGGYTYTLSNGLAAVQALPAGATATDTFSYTATERLFAAATTNTGTAGTLRPGLLGGDLTDPENNGDPENNVNYNANFFASDEPSFGGGEAAFNVFDNQVGGGNAKWCCIAPAPSQWVAAQFNQPYVLTHFTLSSGNDSPERRPDIWMIQGSNNSTNGSDGTWTPIYSYSNNGTSPFSADNQTLLYTSSEGRTDLTAGAAQYQTGGAAYSWFRYIVFSTQGDTIHQINEVEFFGIPQVRSANASLIVTVTGTNDAPTLGGPNTGNVVEDGTLTATGTLTIVDPDTGESTYTPQSSVAGTYGTFSLTAGGLWNYTLNNAAAVVQGLSGGQTVTDGFTAVSSDGSASRPVTITITGAADAPVLSDPASASVTVNEGGTASNSGTFTDLDVADNVTITATIAGVPVGTVNKTGTNNGSWTWTYNTTNGPSQSGTVTITADDGLGGVATKTFALVVNNVAPVFTLPASATLTLADSGVFSLPNVPFTDPGADVWIGTANFGDGTGVLPVSVNQGAKTFSLLHAYQFGGTYTVAVTINDQDPGGATTHTMTVTIPQPTQTYADDDWAGFANGTSIPDADPVLAGPQPAVYGYDAFASPHIAVFAVAPGGFVTVNAGTYHETASIGKTVSVNFQEGPILIDSLSDTVSTAALTLSGITLSLGAGSLSSPVGGSGGVTKIGPGTLTFTGSAANTYAGTTRVNDGLLALAKTGAESVVGAVVIGDGDNNLQPVNVKTAILRVSTSDQIADASTITFLGDDGRLHIAAGASETTLAPTFDAGDVKIAGTLTTTGAYLQTGGTTTMAGGTLRVGASGTLDSSITGTLQGSGTIYTKILTSNGTIDPSSGVTDADIGNASRGVLTIRGNLQMTAASVTNLDVGTSAGVAVTDQLNVGINTALPLPAGSYTNLSNYDLDPYLRGDVAAVTEPGRRGVNDLYNINGTVRFDGTLNVRPLTGSAPANNVTHGNSMNFVWRALNLPPGDLNPRGGNLSSVPSDFTTRNSYTAAGVLVAPAAATGTRFEARFMGSAGQANAIGQAVSAVVVSGGNNLAILSAPAYVVGQAKALTLTSLTAPATTNTNLKMTKQVWNAMRDSHTRVTVTVTNTSTLPLTLTGPFYLEVTSTPSNVAVFNQNGKTQAGRPYLVVVPRDAAGNALSTLAAGAAATVEVDLLTPFVLGKNLAIAANVLLGGLP